MTALPRSLGVGDMPAPSQSSTPPPDGGADGGGRNDGGNADTAASIWRKSINFTPAVPDRWTDTLEKLMRRDVDAHHLLGASIHSKVIKRNQKLIFLHPEDGDRDYTDEEMESAKGRDFETRLFIASTSCGGNSVFLRTRHSDNHPHETGIYNFVRDYLKASSSTKSFTAAKAALTRLLTISFDMCESEYCTFASTMASGLSGNATNTSFEKGYRGDLNAMLKVGERPVKLRRELCILMHIIFTKIQKHQFMLNGGSNVYRLFHCRTKTSRDKFPVYIALFTFIFQITLTGYVVAQLYNNFREQVYADTQNLRNIPLAALTFLYSAILAKPIMSEVPEGFKIFGSYGVLQTLDYIVNGVLPIVLLVSGFFVIWGQQSYIEAVLNTAALLFVPMIDDELPQVLGFRPESIVKNFLIHEAMEEFDRLHVGDITERKRLKMKFYKDAIALGMGIQFADHLITNGTEQGSSHTDGVLFQPFQVRKGKTKDNGDQIDPSSFITENCLIKKITWKFTVYKPNPNTSQPRVGYLKIEMLNGQTVEVNRTFEEGNVGLCSEEYSLKGVYMITMFQMSTDILRLRVCGSRTAGDFEAAMNYYALWPMSSNAKKLLKIDQANGGEMKPLLDNEHRV